MNKIIIILFLGPTLAECRSLWLGELDTKLRGGLDSVSNVSKLFAEKTAKIARQNNQNRLTSGTLTSEPEMTQQQPFNIIFGGDLVLGARMLKHMAERMHYGKILSEFSYDIQVI